MKKQQVDHILRATGGLTGEKQFVIIGSRSLHGKYPDVADDILRSFEVDLIAKKHPNRSEWLNFIGQDSRFHETRGYYADPVDENTATLPKGWKARLVNLPPGDTLGVSGLCLDPHDLAIAKYVAWREKDMVFTRALAARGWCKRRSYWRCWRARQSIRGHASGSKGLLTMISSRDDEMHTRGGTSVTVNPSTLDK